MRADWTGFHASTKWNLTQTAVNSAVLKQLEKLTQSTRNERRRQVFEQNRKLLRQIPKTSRKVIAEFVDEVLKRCPNIGIDNLKDVAEILAKLEKARSGYELLERLSDLKADDLDELSSLLEKWTLRDMQTVLDELHWRLDLIKKLQAVVTGPITDELHGIHPLFNRGLWIFGPEYESIEFISNRALATVIRDFLGKKDVPIKNPARRPDLIAVPTGTIGIFARNKFDQHQIVSGYSKVLLVELKRADVPITIIEQRQAHDYTLELRRSGAVQSDTQIVGFVLGPSVADDARLPLDQGQGLTVITALPYSVVLAQAHARTFTLLEQLGAFNHRIQVDLDRDKDMEDVLNTEEQLEIPFSASATDLSKVAAFGNR